MHLVIIGGESQKYSPQLTIRVGTALKSRVWFSSGPFGLELVGYTFRLSNHPDFVGIIPILLENPESQPICDRDRKNPDFDSC